MKKIIGFISSIFVLIIVISSSCSGDTYAKRLDDEEKLIKKFRVDSGLTFRTTYPEDGKFGEKEYFYYNVGDTAVYFRVIDPGSEVKAVPFVYGVSSGTNVYFLFKNTFPITEETTTPANNYGGNNAIEFTYGLANTYSSTSGIVASYMSYAIALPLRYVGDGAEVSMIVPFRSGSSYQNQYYTTMYYGSIKYIFKK